MHRWLLLARDERPCAHVLHLRKELKDVGVLREVLDEVHRARLQPRVTRCQLLWRDWQRTLEAIIFKRLVRKARTTMRLWLGTVTTGVL